MHKRFPYGRVLEKSPVRSPRFPEKLLNFFRDLHQSGAIANEFLGENQADDTPTERASAGRTFWDSALREERRPPDVAE
jgi:hypothetical protein